MGGAGTGPGPHPGRTGTRPAADAGLGQQRHGRLRAAGRRPAGRAGLPAAGRAYRRRRCSAGRAATRACGAHLHRCTAAARRRQRGAAGTGAAGRRGRVAARLHQRRPRAAARRGIRARHLRAAGGHLPACAAAGAAGQPGDRRGGGAPAPARWPAEQRQRAAGAGRAAVSRTDLRCQPLQPACCAARLGPGSGRLRRAGG